MSSARTAFALAALAALATIGQHHAAALPVDLSAPAAAQRGDGLVPDAGAQRARRGLGLVGDYFKQVGNNLVKDVTGGNNAATNSVSQAGNNVKKGWNGGNNDFTNWWKGAFTNVKKAWNSDGKKDFASAWSKLAAYSSPAAIFYHSTKCRWPTSCE